MLDAVKDIGEMSISVGRKSLLDVLIEDPNQNGSYKNIIAINFTVDGNDVKYKDVTIEETDSQKISRYLYSSAGGNGPGYMPVAKITEPDKTFNGKILSWFKILSKKGLNIDEDERRFLENLNSAIQENRDEILEEIVKFIKQSSKKDKFVLMLKFVEGSTYKYIGDMPLFRKLLVDTDNEKYNKLSANDKVCSICGEKKDLVFGKVDTYAFYTIDKTGYIVGGFDEKKSWRNFPVCPDCRLKLEEGKKYIENNLTFKFYGLKYQLIPKFLIGEKFVKEEILDIFKESSKLVSLKESTKKRVITDEDDIMYFLKDADDSISLNYLFIEKQNSAERILLLIEDVFPSHLREIFKAKDIVDGIFNENFTFKNIRNFLFKSDMKKRDSDLDGYFLDLTDRIFRGRKIDINLILKFIMKRVRDEFIQDKYYQSAIKDGMMTIKFLQNLGLVEMEVKAMEERPLSDFFKKYDENFETPIKRGLVLLGALTELLLRKQYKDRGAKPFMKNLKSLKMDEKDIRGLLPKVQNKLEEYDSFDKGKRLLAKEVSNYLLLAGDDWHMPVDEINFYFACGLNLADEIASIIYSKGEEQ
ncbi:type I-B CRISPR-associated protein Cas8b/Csh1 [Thermoanaerobacterium sp. PSU-2]|uniref:TIGR02556 family CRISPR-associated protein n=1 Tax=Thermoanaerobacterium sp. PSU-2 TaxID=1930849 RepID=UPI000A16A60A|nr:TIGR02556 family CRISPR-associated protein [Thermoanaerobacterium sp. PSU-2]ORX22590.1 type I-B CRISPR-associated protein Cas8b/Csh1 [Thermoanaerobacterium sp. PSU-2]